MLHPYSDSRHRDDSFIYFISLKEAVKPFQRDYWVLKIQDIKRHCTIGKGGDNSKNNGLLVATSPRSFMMVPTPSHPPVSVGPWLGMSLEKAV